MGWPIRYRMRNKETGEILKGDNEIAYFVDSNGIGLIAGLERYYPSIEWENLHHTHYLEVALSKNEDGTWNYIRLGEE